MPYVWTHTPENPTFSEWLQTGIDAGWLTNICIFHSWIDQMTRHERDAWNETAETCMPRWVVSTHGGHRD